MRFVSLIIAPHPDDETLACGGTLQDRLARGHDVRIVVLTDGRASHLACFGITERPSPDELARMRAAEFRRVAALLGVPEQNVLLLGFPDARLAEHEAQAAQRLQAVLPPLGDTLREVFYPSALETHPDHLAAHRIVNAALDGLDARPLQIRYTIWPREDALRPEANLEVGIGAYLPVKRRAMALYVSQMERIAPAQPAPVLEPEMLANFLEEPVERFQV